MKTSSAALLLACALAGCGGTMQTAVLYPRGDGPQGAGHFDAIAQILTVELDGNTYSGRPIQQTSYTTGYGFMRGSSTTTNAESALLTGPAGQIRCDFQWSAWRERANGTCVDRENRVYDLLIQN